MASNVGDKRRAWCARSQTASRPAIWAASFVWRAREETRCTIDREEKSRERRGVAGSRPCALGGRISTNIPVPQNNDTSTLRNHDTEGVGPSAGAFPQHRCVTPPWSHRPKVRHHDSPTARKRSNVMAS